MASVLESFTVVGKEHLGHEDDTVFGDYEVQQSAKYASPVISLSASIRRHHPGMTVSLSLANNVPLLAYAAAGYATCELDTSEDAVLRLRGFLRPTSHEDPGHLVDSTSFARYTYGWESLNFVLYAVTFAPYTYQFLLFPPDDDEDVLSNSKATDALILKVGQIYYGPFRDSIFVFDSYWSPSTSLFDEVQKISWKDVILNQEMKDAVSNTIEEFFNNEQKYRDLDVPWKRGIIFYGPPGNGKTISLKALMHSLSLHRKDVTLLYVRSIGNSYALGQIFGFARAYSPCLLIIEDIDTQVTPDMRSYFFNEVDGLENNNGIMMIATTNHLDQLDEGLKRPSRFDRRYLFPLPSYDERIQYCEFWRKKLEKNDAKIDFPKALSPKIAKITDEFSFATLKEAFVATLLAMARSDEDEANHDKDFDNLPLWKEMQKQVALLRKEMGKKDVSSLRQYRHSGDAGSSMPGFESSDVHTPWSSERPHPPLPTRVQPPRPDSKNVPPPQPIIFRRPYSPLPDTQRVSAPRSTEIPSFPSLQDMPSLGKSPRITKLSFSKQASGTLPDPAFSRPNGISRFFPRHFSVAPSSSANFPGTERFGVQYEDPWAADNHW